MAVRTPTIDDIPGELYARNCVLVTWSGILTGDTCAPVQLPDFADRSVQFAGTFDGATMTLEGSNDGTNYHTLNDAQAIAISKTSADLEQVAELTAYVKPVTTGGGASQNTTVTLVARRA